MENKNLIILIAYVLTSMLNIECYSIPYGSESSSINKQRVRVNNNNYGSASQQYQTASSSSSNGISQKSSGSYESIYQPIENTCEIGVSQAIYSRYGLLETYCRCPSGTYGFTCKENYHNPCQYNNENMYYAADSSLPKNYFVHCEWNVASLLKCPENLHWNQDILSCDHVYRKTSDYARSDYTSQQNEQKRPTVQRPTFQTQTYGGYSVNTNEQPKAPIQRPAFQTQTYGGYSVNTNEQPKAPIQRPAVQRPTQQSQDATHQIYNGEMLENTY